MMLGTCSAHLSSPAFHHSHLSHDCDLSSAVTIYLDVQRLGTGGWAFCRLWLNVFEASAGILVIFLYEWDFHLVCLSKQHVIVNQGELRNSTLCYVFRKSFSFDVASCL
jgi:hypothetical protein